MDFLTTDTAAIAAHLESLRARGVTCCTRDNAGTLPHGYGLMSAAEIAAFQATTTIMSMRPGTAMDCAASVDRAVAVANGRQW